MHTVEESVGPSLELRGDGREREGRERTEKKAHANLDLHGRDSLGSFSDHGWFLHYFTQCNRQCRKEQKS